MIFTATALQGKTILVTGATGGAGTATARLIARCGGTVVCMGRDPERVTKMANELPGGGHSAVWPEGGEVRVPDRLIDGIFHAAGIEQIAPMGMVSGELCDKVFGPSLGIAMKLLRLVGTRSGSNMKDGGSIVLMSSVAAVRGTPGMTVYSASKGAIEALTLSAAMEFAPRRIRVNAIRAGAFESPMHTRMMARTTQHGADDYAAKHPLGFGRAEDIANAAVFLLSDAARWVTGGIFPIDGGFSAK